MRSISTLVLGSLLVLPAVAIADDNTPLGGGGLPARPLVVEPRGDGVLLARQVVTSDPTPSTGADPDSQVAASIYIYLNKNGAVLNAGGTNNSSTNVSTIVPGTRNFPAWSVPATEWSTIVTSIQQMFAPFNATVSDVAPPPGTRHIEALFGGTAADALPADQVPDPSQGYILGVSPFTPDCAVIEDSIVFTFAVDAKNLGQTPRQIAEIAAQEIAHSYGLDHARNASDPMTYLDYTGSRSFKAGAVSCGEYSDRLCGLVTQGFPSCRPNQDSVGLLTERIGTGGSPGDITPPSVSINAPLNNALVPRDFDVYADADDNVAVTSVELYVDDVLVDSASTSPYQLRASGVSLGDHTVRVVATDGAQQSDQQINVTVDDNADPVDPPDPSNPGGDGDDDYVTGGCSTGGQSGGVLLLGIALIGLIRRRR